MDSSLLVYRRLLEALEEFLLTDKIYQFTRQCVTPIRSPKQARGGMAINFSIIARPMTEHAFRVLKER
jgi:hypothetical protein